MVVFGIVVVVMVAVATGCRAGKKSTFIYFVANYTTAVRGPKLGCSQVG